MVDPSTESQRSLRDVLRAIELDEKHHMPLPIAPNPSDEPKHSSAPLTPPVVSRLGDIADAEAPDDWEDMEAEGVSAWWSNRIGFSMFAAAAVGASFIAPVAIMVLAGSIVITPSQNGAWAVASLDTIKFDEKAAPASLPMDQQGDVRQAGFMRIQGFAGLWQSLAGDAPQPRLSTKLTIEASPGETVALPIHIESAQPLPSTASLVVRGVPEFAALSAAEPQQDGSWRVPIPAARDVKLTAYAQPTQDQELTIELQDAGGQVVSRASTVFKAGEAPVVAAIAPVEAPSAVAPVSRAKSQPASAKASAQPAAAQNMSSWSSSSSKASAEAAPPAPPAAREAKPKRTASAPMRAGLNGVLPQPRPAPKTPRIVIVDGPLPASAAPMASYAPPSAPVPAPAAITEPSIHDASSSWKEPWARDAFRSHK